MSAFLHPAMLWGLLLAAVPILIHLLSRRRYRTVRWAAMEFLRAAFKKNQKRLRIENLLLLILRTALIVLLVFALSRPFLSGVVAETLSDRTTNYTVILDNSYSMGLNEGVTTPFKRAVEEAKKIATTTDREDSITLYLTNDNFSLAGPGIPRSILRDSHEADKVAGVLGRLRVSTGRSELVDVLAAVSDELDAKRTGKRVVLITDLQRTAWETGVEAEADRREADDELGGAGRTIQDLLADIERKGASFHLIDVGANDPANAALTG
ncbi:MAG: BatA domain-containing protein, partial [Planctomycetota bacterium]